MTASVVIPCYMLPDKEHELLRFTRACVDSLRRHSPGVELVIVDNGSPVDADYLQSVADIYIRNESNLGYPPAVNQGLRAASGEWLVVSNNDIEFIHDWPATAVAAWDEHTGVVSSHLHANDPEHKAGRFVAPWGHFFGALWMTHRQILDELGYLDEQYEMGYYEDKDFVLRVVTANYEHIKVGWCLHIGNGTSGKMSNLPQYFFANKARFEAKWHLA